MGKGFSGSSYRRSWILRLEMYIQSATCPASAPPDVARHIFKAINADQHIQAGEGLGHMPSTY
jgi:hypothetical protein